MRNPRSRRVSSVPRCTLRSGDGIWAPAGPPLQLMFSSLCLPFGVAGCHPASTGSHPSQKQCSREGETPCGEITVSSKEPSLLAAVDSQPCERPAPLTLLSLSASEITMYFTILFRAVLDLKPEGLGKCDETCDWGSSVPTHTLVLPFPSLTVTASTAKDPGAAG